jgi:hypothetical protein
MMVLVTAKTREPGNTAMRAGHRAGFGQHLSFSASLDETFERQLPAKNQPDDGST